MSFTWTTIGGTTGIVGHRYNTNGVTDTYTNTRFMLRFNTNGVSTSQTISTGTEDASVRRSETVAGGINPQDPGGG